MFHEPAPEWDYNARMSPQYHILCNLSTFCHLIRERQNDASGLEFLLAGRSLCKDTHFFMQRQCWSRFLVYERLLRLCQYRISGRLTQFWRANVYRHGVHIYPLVMPTLPSPWSCDFHFCRFCEGWLFPNLFETFRKFRKGSPIIRLTVSSYLWFLARKAILFVWTRIT